METRRKGKYQMPKSCSIPFSRVHGLSNNIVPAFKKHGAGEGSRTLVASLGSWCITVMLHPPVRFPIQYSLSRRVQMQKGKLEIFLTGKMQKGKNLSAFSISVFLRDQGDFQRLLSHYRITAYSRALPAYGCFTFENTFLRIRTPSGRWKVMGGCCGSGSGFQS